MVWIAFMILSNHTAMSALLSVEQRYTIAWQAIKSRLEDPAIQQAIIGIATAAKEKPDNIINYFGHMPLKSQGTVLWMMNKGIDDPESRFKLSSVLAEFLNTAGAKVANMDQSAFDVPPTQEGTQLVENGIVKIPHLLSRDEALSVLPCLPCAVSMLTT